MTAVELAAWLTARGWAARVADAETVEATHPDRRRPRRYLRTPTLLGAYWRVVDERR